MATLADDNPARTFLPRMQALDEPFVDVPAATANRHVGEIERLPQRPPPAQVFCPSAPATAPTTPPPTTSFHAVNVTSKKTTPKKMPEPTPPTRRLAPLAPAPPRTTTPSGHQGIGLTQHSGASLYSLPAEIRVDIYRLVLENVTIHILPREAGHERRRPHPLTLTSKIVRNEVLPLIHANCAIMAVITDFNFSGMLDFVARIPPNELNALAKNQRLKIQFSFTTGGAKDDGKTAGETQSLRSWLQYRADKCRPQAKWQYSGVRPPRKVESFVRRRIKRMTEEGKRQEMVALAKGMQIDRIQEKESTSTSSR